MRDVLHSASFPLSDRAAVDRFVDLVFLDPDATHVQVCVLEQVPGTTGADVVEPGT